MSDKITNMQASIEAIRLAKERAQTPEALLANLLTVQITYTAALCDMMTVVAERLPVPETKKGLFKR